MHGKHICYVTDFPFYILCLFHVVLVLSAQLCAYNKIILFLSICRKQVLLYVSSVESNSPLANFHLATRRFITQWINNKQFLFSCLHRRFIWGGYVLVNIVFCRKREGGLDTVNGCQHLPAGKNLQANHQRRERLECVIGYAKPGVGTNLKITSRCKL